MILSMDILGTKIDFLSKQEVINRIYYVIARRVEIRPDEAIPTGSPRSLQSPAMTLKMKPTFIVTANGEFLLQARKDPEFANALGNADLILPDGVGLLWAGDFVRESKRRKSSSDGGRLNDSEAMTPPRWTWMLAFKIFIKTLRGGYSGQTIAGVELVKFFLQSKSSSHGDRVKRSETSGSSEADEDNVKIFLLGGHHGVARLLAEKYNCDFHSGVADVKNITPAQNKEIASIIKKVNPDILFVSFGHFAQEKWIAKNLENLFCKVVLGVGSSFDELAGIGPWKQPVPMVFKKTGLKWLWRLIKNPGHINRSFNAVILFPWEVFKCAIK